MFVTWKDYMYFYVSQYFLLPQMQTNIYVRCIQNNQTSCCSNANKHLCQKYLKQQNFLLFKCKQSFMSEVFKTTKLPTVTMQTKIHVKSIQNNKSIMIHMDTCKLFQVRNIVYHVVYLTLVFQLHGMRGGVVVKALCYKPAGSGFDSRWCHRNFLVT